MVLYQVDTRYIYAASFKYKMEILLSVKRLKVITAKWQVGAIWPMDLVFMNTFTDQSMDIACVVKLRHLSGSLGERVTLSIN